MLHHSYNRIHFIIAFITFIGYSIGLSLIIYNGYIGLSRYYTIPLRVLMAALMLFLISSKNYRICKQHQALFSLFVLFWISYLAAILRELTIPGNAGNFTIEDIVSYSVLTCIIPFIYFFQNKNEKIISNYLKAILLSGLIFAGISYLLYGQFLFSGIGRISHVRYYATGINNVLSPLAFSYISSLVIAICIYKLFFRKQAASNKKYLIIIICASLVPFLLGASRGSVIALFLPFVIIMLVQKDLKRRTLLITAFILFSAAVILLSESLGSSLITRLLNTYSDIEDQTTSASRLLIWQVTLEQFMKSPIWGNSIYCRIPPYPHNIILEVLMAVGLLGFIPFISLVAIAIKRSIKIVRYQPEYTWIFIFFAQSFIQNMFSGAIFSAIWFWSSMGLVLSAKFDLHSAKNHHPSGT